MRETTYATEKIILRVLDEYKKTQPTKLSLMVSEGIMGRIRTQRPKIRPGLVRLGYEICGGQNWKKTIPICAAMEILNVSTYAINQIFDQKGGPWTKHKIDNQIIAGILQRELANELLNHLQLTDRQTLVWIEKILSETNKITYIGQYLDLNILQIKNIPKWPNLADYLIIYTRRCYCFGGKFYENALISGALLAKAGKAQIVALKNFGRFFGTGLQIVNDLGDFVPPDKKPYPEAFKYYQDQYGDLRQGKLTLPIYLMLHKASTVEKKFILKQVGNPSITLADGYKLTKFLIHTGAFDYLKKLTNHHVRQAKKQLKTFPKSLTKDLLSAVTSNAKSSIYWKILKSI